MPTSNNQNTPENERYFTYTPHHTRWVETIAIALFISSFTVYMAYMMILTPNQENMTHYLTHELCDSFEPGISYSSAVEKLPAKPDVNVFLTETATASGTGRIRETITIKDKIGNELVLKFSEDQLVSKKFTWLLNNQIAARKTKEAIKEGYESMR